MEPSSELLHPFETFTLDLQDIDLPTCTYSDFNEIDNIVSVDKLSLLVCNVRSCRRNFNAFYSHFNQYVSKFTIIVLVETWLTKEICNIFNISGYKYFDCFRANNAGGIRMYYKRFLNVKLLPVYSSNTDIFEVLTAEISCSEKNVLLSCFYHPPSPDHQQNRFFIDQCLEILQRLRRTGLPVIGCGDFNLNLFNPLRLSYIKDFIDGMLECGMLPAITIPTKINPGNTITRYTLIDQIWTNISNKVTDSFVIPTEIADHFPVSASFNLNSTQNVNILTKRNFNHANNINFSAYLSDINVEVMGDMNLTFDTYFMNVYEAYDVSYPLITQIVRDDKNCPWITPLIKCCIKKKSKLFRMCNRGTIHKEQYTLFKNRLTTLLRRAKRLYYFKLFYRCQRDSRKLWFHINKVIGKKVRVPMECLKVNQNVLMGTEMVNYANAYFVSIANNLTVNLVYMEPMLFGEPNPHSFAFMPTNEREVANVIRSLKNKGNGINDIGIVTLKNNNYVFSQHISSLYNLSIDRDTFPDSLKVACVVPGHKKGPKDEIDNFRPISNLPLVSKVFEKLTLNRLISFLNTYNLLADAQYGFRQGRSTTQAAVRLTTFITTSFSEKKYGICFFLDLRKAFDIVDHSILKSKLYHCGFRGKIYNYLSSYIANRRQFVQIGDYKSEEMAITKGVPQGSLMGPLLFNIYINDIVEAAGVDSVLFADDAAFFVSAVTLPELYEKIQILFDKLSEYLRRNKLIPNLGKSKLMMFSNRFTGVLPDFMFDGVAIEWVRDFKYLGLTLTNNMCFGLHINNICTQISQYTGIFHYLNKSLPLSILKLLYNAFILPHLILHIEIWGAAPNTHLDKVQVKQNKLLRAILGVQTVDYIPEDPTSEMYRSTNFLNVRNLFKFYLFKFLANIVQGQIPYFYDRLLRPLELQHRYGTRHHAFRQPFITNEVVRRSMSPQLVSLFNSLPPQIDVYTVSTSKALRMYKQVLRSNQ